MALSPTDSHLFGALFSDAEMAELFSDAACIRSWLDVEASLARVQGRLGVIPAEVAQHIDAVLANLPIDPDGVRAGIARDGVPIAALVAQVRQAVDPEAAPYVHWGATTQDVMDTGLVLRLRAALRVLENLLGDVMSRLAEMTRVHRTTLMPGRTHAQHAVPITFGLKVAGWLAPLIRHRRRLAELRPRLLVVQLGGAAGTLAALDQRGPDVLHALADELGLGVPLLPWHTQRDGLAELAGWLSLVSGSLGKMAQDLILLAQSEVDEVHESSEVGRGSSSTMPQKHNPVASEVILAAARTNATLLGALHHALVQEHERGTHGWQIEWMVLPQMLALTAAALRQAAFLGRHLAVDVERMRRNVADSQGMLLAEALRLALAPHLGADAARQLIAEAGRIARREGFHLVELVRSRTDAPVDWAILRDESTYLGAADAFIERVLAEAADLLDTPPPS